MKNIRGIAVLLMWVFVALAVLVPATEAQSVSTSRHWRTVPQGHYTSVHYRRYYHRHFYQRYSATDRSLHPVVIVTA